MKSSYQCNSTLCLFELPVFFVLELTSVVSVTYGLIYWEGEQGCRF